MFYKDQTEEQKKSYQDFLTIIGSLSNLSSDSTTPFLFYRIAEKIFCRSFEAEDLSRSDVSSDAKKKDIGIGLKTFLIKNNKTLEKVAEFNRDRSLYSKLENNPDKLIKEIAKLRNARIEFTENSHGIKNSIYHCVLRDEGKFKIFEEPMHKIDIDRITNVTKKNNSIRFNDSHNEYSFNLTKSTLFKRFLTENVITEFEVKILKDPLKELQKILLENKMSFEKSKKIKQTIFLPLYGRNKTVFPKSGLNQWNAGGRNRDANEVYIPVPASTHKNTPGFFPKRDTSFTLKLPDGTNMKSKICQEGDKALMSYSNKELGKWLLRDLLKLKEGELLTYEKLQTIGIDSVRIDKINDEEFELNFAEIGSYEEFISTFEN